MATLATLRGGDKKERELYKIYHEGSLKSSCSTGLICSRPYGVPTKKKQKQKTD